MSTQTPTPPTPLKRPRERHFKTKIGFDAPASKPTASPASVISLATAATSPSVTALQSLPAAPVALPTAPEAAAPQRSASERPRFRPLEPAAPDLQSGSVVAGRYRLERRLGAGGMGRAWAAIDERGQVPVVLKVMSHALSEDDEALRRFEQEALAVAEVRSPHVVRFLDAGVDGRMPFLVLERLDGEDLAERLDRVKRLDLAACDQLLLHLVNALRASHASGVVHRDVKPANVFMTIEDGPAGPREVAKLLDFGVAKLHQGKSRVFSRSGVSVGSPQFMSPEQVRAEPDLDGRSDLFSLATLIYTALCGRMPFEGRNMSATMLRIMNGEYVPPSALGLGLPVALDPFFATAFAVDPARRFASGDAMWAAFHEVVEAKARQDAPPPPPPRRELAARPAPLPATRTTAPRRRVSTTVAATAMLVLCVMVLAACAAATSYF